MPDFGEEPAVAAELVKLLSGRGKMIAFAESCTAGLAADMIARIPGASKVLWGSFVTYTADAKTKMLGVPKGLIDRHGAVSSPVSLAMAEGALARSGASWAVSITGLAGPGGEGAEGPPVGTVWIGLAGRAGARMPAEAKRFLFKGSRNEVRTAAAAAALNELLRKILTAEEFLV
jgi:PncC family amidohydrolase